MPDWWEDGKRLPLIGLPVPWALPKAGMDRAFGPKTRSHSIPSPGIRCEQVEPDPTIPFCTSDKKHWSIMTCAVLFCCEKQAGIGDTRTLFDLMNAMAKPPSR
jgi:hypothetical protein